MKIREEYCDKKPVKFDLIKNKKSFIHFRYYEDDCLVFACLCENLKKAREQLNSYLETRNKIG